MENEEQQESIIQPAVSGYLERGNVWLGIVAVVCSIVYELFNSFYIDWSGFTGEPDPAAAAHNQAGAGAACVFFVSLFVLLAWSPNFAKPSSKAHLITTVALVVVAIAVPLCNFGAQGSLS